MSMKTLERFSLDSIAKDMSLWCNASIADLNRFKYVLGPFDGLSEFNCVHVLSTILNGFVTQHL